MCETLKLRRWVPLAASGFIIVALAITVVAADDTSPEYLAAQVKLLTAENQRVKEQLKQALDRVAKLEERVARLEGAAGKPIAPADAAAAKDSPAPAGPAQPAKPNEKVADKTLAANDAVVKAIGEYATEMARIENAELTKLQTQQARTAAVNKLERALAGNKVTFGCKVDDVTWDAEYGASVRLTKPVFKTSEGEVSKFYFGERYRDSPLLIQATEQEAAAIGKGSDVTISGTLSTNEKDYYVTHLGRPLFIKLSAVTINGKAVRLPLRR